MSEQTPQGSYDLDAMKNKETEFDRLRKRTTYRMADLIPLLTEYGMENGKSILDVDCGQGIRTKQIADQFPQSQVAGIDRSETMIESAKANSGPNLNLSFHCRDILDLPFEPNSFDFMYSRLVFMHLQEPLKVIGYLKTLLKPGGQIIIEDADRDFMKFYPHPDGFEEYWQRIQQGQRRLGGNPNIGTQLASLFSLSGMEDIHVNMLPIVGDGEEAARVARDLLFLLNDFLPESEQADGKAMIELLLNMCQRDEMRYYHIWLVVSAAKPKVS